MSPIQQQEGRGKAPGSGTRPLMLLKTLGSSRAFTLIELMVVVGVMGVALTMGLPIVYRMRHEAPLRKAVRDIIEVCSQARARAILQSKAVAVVFHPRDHRLEVEGGGGVQAGKSGVDIGGAAPLGSGTVAEISDRVVIEMLDVDLTEYKDSEVVKVWFYPNGVCDELTLILFDPSVGQDPRRVISFEVTTGLANVEVDPRALITSRR